MYFEYCDNNDIIKDSSGRILFSNYMEIENKLPNYPVPFNRNPYNKFRPDNTINLGFDGNLYEIEYYHNGYIIDINKLII